MQPIFKKPDYYERIIPVELTDTPSPFIYTQANTMCRSHGTYCNYTYFTSYNSEVVADDVIVVGDEYAGKFILVGATTAYRSLTHLAAVWRGHRFREIRVWQPEIKEGETPEKIVVLEGADWRRLLLDYADLVAAEMHAMQPRKDAATVLGYCSWYYYYKDVTEKNFLENVDTLAKLQDSPFKARYVQIDDGYQTFQGDWNDQNPSWPTPLREIAAGIRAKGMEAGIWTMPFHASTASRVFREHPDWFVKGEDGKPVVVPGWSAPPDHLWATFDATQEEVLDHLRRIFRTFREWGYTYFKMDGLGFAMTDGVRSDPGATSVSAFRKGLQAIREAVPDSFLLACSQHFMPCVGLVDGARFSNDTAANGNAIVSVFNQTLARFWMIDRFYLADPDCLIVRDDRGSQTLGESRISALSGILTGFALTSDNLALVPKDRFELLSRAANIRMRDVRPESVLRPIRASIWPTAFSGTVGGRPAVAVANITGDPLEVEIGKLPGFAGDSCEELLRPLGKVSGKLTVEPHDAVLLVQ